jgi:hypothetical protein
VVLTPKPGSIRGNHLAVAVNLFDRRSDRVGAGIWYGCWSGSWQWRGANLAIDGDHDVVKSGDAGARVGTIFAGIATNSTESCHTVWHRRAEITAEIDRVTRVAACFGVGQIEGHAAIVHHEADAIDSLLFDIGAEILGNVGTATSQSSSGFEDADELHFTRGEVGEVQLQGAVVAAIEGIAKFHVDRLDTIDGTLVEVG